MPESMNIVLAILAANVAAVYLTIAAFVVPKITLTNASRRFELIFRAAAVSFFVGCGFSHIHLGLRALDATKQTSIHQVWMHVMQAIGGWLFVWAALRFLEIRVERIDPTIAELEQLAMRDPLTGAHNRRAFDSTMASATAEAIRADEPMSLLIMDLDDFKRVNDEFGHSAGDDMLRALVEIVDDSIRPGDSLARLGGDEFGLVLPGASRSAAGVVATRIQHTVAARAVDGPSIAVSIGIASLPDDGVVPARLEIAADRAMYEAKRGQQVERKADSVIDIELTRADRTTAV